ncbi:MAG: hypothetical protein HGA65_06005 [Oscillochloris sp.]|nr:hypothetical protein [Oscillochloris sp.]
MQDNDLQHWVGQQLPADLTIGPPEVRRYDDELVIILPVAAPDDPAAAAQEIARLREESRRLRMGIAREIERTERLPVAWGMRAGAHETLFTSRTAPVMTRLGRAEREVLDTLVAAGVAETRSSALAYTVRAFAATHDTWLGEVRQAIAEVERVRARLHVTPRKGPPTVNESE